MKKLALLIAILTIFTSTVFAQIEVTVEGSSELTFGINLDDSAAGFKNNNSSKISFKLADGSSEKGGEADVYGWIEIKEWKAEVNSSDGYKALDAGDVTAKIMFNGGWLKISGTNTATNFADPAVLNSKDYKGVSSDIGGAGFVLGLDVAPAAIEIGVSTPNDWTQDDTGTAASTGDYGWYDNDSNEQTQPAWLPIQTAAVPATDDINDEYTFGAHLKITMDLSPLKVEVGAVADINPNTVIGVGGKVTADVAPATIAVAVDSKIPQGDGADDPSTEVALDVSLALGEGMTLALGASYSTIDNIDAFVDFDAAIDAISIGILGIFADAVEVNDSGAELHYIVEVDASYTTDTVKPYLTIGYGTLSDANDDGIRTLEAGDATTKLKVGCEAYLIENVTLKGEWRDRKSVV